MIMLFKYIITLILLLQINNVKAWNAAGHEIMAAIAWNIMSQKQQTYWSDILKHHPRYDKDFIDYLPKYIKKNPQLLNQWVFRQAARWPDLPRGFQQKQKQKYHHGSWHYINYPLYLNQKIDTSFLNLDTHFHNKFNNKLNIIQALKGNIAILKKNSSSKKDKALSLSWVLHLVGDAHQPLHSTAMFSQYYFPQGDRGGNLSKIKGQGRYKNLHWYWDSVLDNTTQFKIVSLKAQKINQTHNKISKKQRKQPIEKWIKQAHHIAQDIVYPKEILVELRHSEYHHKKQPKININNQYDIKARAVAKTEIAKSAYRLVNILKKVTIQHK